MVLILAFEQKHLFMVGRNPTLFCCDECFCLFIYVWVVCSNWVLNLHSLMLRLSLSFGFFFIIILSLPKRFHFWKFVQLLCWMWLFLYNFMSWFWSIQMTWKVLWIEQTWMCRSNKKYNLHRQYVSSLNLVVISQLSNLFFCNNPCTPAKVCYVVWLKCHCFVWWSTLNLAWIILDFSR